MATEAWDATYEAEPLNTDKRHLGDDEFRDMKVNIRESLQQGGHYDPSGTTVLSTTENDRGRHVIDAGGAGVGPDIYQSDATTKLVTYADNGAQIDGYLRLHGLLSLGDLSSGITVTGPTTKTVAEASETTSIFILDLTSGAITLDLPTPSTSLPMIVCHVPNGANVLTIGNPATIITSRSTKTTNFSFPSGWSGMIVFYAISATTYRMWYDRPWSQTIDHTATGDVDAEYLHHYMDASGGTCQPNLPPRSTANGGIEIFFHKVTDTNQSIITASSGSGDTINTSLGGTTPSLTMAAGVYGTYTFVANLASATDWLYARTTG